MKLTDFIYNKMEKNLNKLISLNKALVPNRETAIKADENANLNIIVWGDPQISLLSPLRSARVYSACRDIENSSSKFDALVMLGDITEYGAKCEYNFTYTLLNSIEKKFDNIFAITGNHDIRLRNYKKQIAKFNSFLKMFSNGQVGDNNKYYFSKYVNGYKFIMMGADRTAFEASYISDEQIKWLDEELKQEQNKGKPVFIFNHQPLKKTNGLPITFLGKGKWRGTIGRESDKVREVFEKYDNVIFLTGHLHYCTNKYTYEDCGKFKAISVPTVGVINHGEFSEFTQGYILSVYDDKIIARARIFGKGEYVDNSIENARFEISLK